MAERLYLDAENFRQAGIHEPNLNFLRKLADFADTLNRLWLAEGEIEDLGTGKADKGLITGSGLTMATNRLLGRDTASTGAIEELTLSEALDLIGSAAQGDILYRGASAWARLGAGTNGHFLKTLGSGANPAWASAAASSTWALAGTGQTATGVYDFAVDGAKATIDFVGLAGKSDIMVIVKACTLSISGSVQVRVSTDNGSTFFSTSGDYVRVASTGIETNVNTCSLWDTNATAARTGTLTVAGANVTGAPKQMVSHGLLSPAHLFIFSADDANDVDAIRALATAGNVNGGKIYCFAR